MNILMFWFSLYYLFCSNKSSFITMGFCVLKGNKRNCNLAVFSLGWVEFGEIRWFRFSISNTAWKVSKYGVFSDPYIQAFGLNTEKYFVSLRSQSKCRKIRTRKNSLFGHISHSGNLCLDFLSIILKSKMKLSFKLHDISH